MRPGGNAELDVSSSSLGTEKKHYCVVILYYIITYHNFIVII